MYYGTGALGAKYGLRSREEYVAERDADVEQQAEEYDFIEEPSPLLSVSPAILIGGGILAAVLAVGIGVMVFGSK